jgi:hypothetical protein
LATSTIVSQPLGERLGLSQVVKHVSALTKLAQNAPQL